MNIVNIVNPTIWVNYHDLTVLPHWNHVLDVGTSSPNGLNLRLLKYYNLPIYILLNQMINHHCMVLPETVFFETYVFSIPKLKVKNLVFTLLRRPMG